MKDQPCGAPSPALMARAEAGLKKLDTRQGLPGWLRIGARATDTASGFTGEVFQIGRGRTYREPSPDFAWLRDGDGPPRLAQINDLDPA